MKSPVAWVAEQRQLRAEQKEWESEQPFRIKVVVNSGRVRRSSLIFDLIIPVFWLPYLFVAEIETSAQIGLGCLLVAYSLNAFFRFQTSGAIERLGRLAERLHYRAGEKDTFVLSQVLNGDPTVVDMISVRKDAKSGEWRSISWLEADTEALMQHVDDPKNTLS